MKKIIKFFFALSILISLNSCDQFLDIKPTDILTEDVALVDFNDFSLALNGGYSALGGGGYYGGNFVAMGELTADNVKIGFANAGQGLFLYNLNFSLDADEPSGFYQQAYLAIYRVNFILSKLDNMKGTQEQKNQIKGEALMIRALAHHDLLRGFAYRYKHTPGATHEGVAIKLIPDISYPSRNTVQEVYDQIFKDVNEAELLLTNTNFPIKFTKSAALAFKSRLTLYKADWAQAENTATDAIVAVSTTAPLSNTTIYPTMWTRTGTVTEAAGESIFKLRMIENNSALGTTFWNRASQTDYFMPNDDAINLFTDAGDVRKAAFFGTATINPRPTIKKFEGTNSLAGIVDIKVFRTSELYLNRAEARFELGKETEARDDLNAVIMARGATVVANTVTGTALRDAIRNERRREFLYEGHRRYDLHRWQLDMNRSDFNGIAASKQLLASSHRFVYPIPQAEMFANKNMKQNPGY